MSESTSQWRLYGGSGKRQNLLESSRRSGDSPLKQGEFYCSKHQCETECYGGDPRRGRRHRQQDASNSLRSRNLWSSEGTCRTRSHARSPAAGGAAGIGNRGLS